MGKAFDLGYEFMEHERSRLTAAMEKVDEDFIRRCVARLADYVNQNPGSHQLFKYRGLILRELYDSGSFGNNLGGKIGRMLGFAVPPGITIENITGINSRLQPTEISLKVIKRIS